MSIEQQSLPLARYRKVDTRLPDQAREEIGRIFCPHVLLPYGRQTASFHARHHTAVHSEYSINYVTYTARVDIDPGELSRFFLVQVPIRGGASVRCGTVTADVEAGVRASILSPTLPTRMTWYDGCEKMIILIGRDALETQFRALVDEPGDNIEFATGIDLTQPGGQRLSRLIELMTEAAESDTTHEAYMVSLRDALTTLLLTEFTHNRSAALDRPIALPAPRAVRRAEAFIAAHAGEAIAMADVADVAGVCLRSLQEAFRQSRNITLTDHLRNVRLNNFHAALKNPDGPQSVTEIALAVGLGHLGRAAAAYRARFGESPHQTLKRR
jgi:AraC-like DNA-binding protein